LTPWNTENTAIYLHERNMTPSKDPAFSINQSTSNSGSAAEKIRETVEYYNEVMGDNLGNDNGNYVFMVSVAGSSHTMMVIYNKTEKGESFYLLDQGTGWGTLKKDGSKYTNYPTDDINLDKKIDKTIQNVFNYFLKITGSEYPKNADFYILQQEKTTLPNETTEPKN
jgi:hypothetical protein